jgi:hypothetical protein
MPMKPTRKQKLRKKVEKRRRTEERKDATVRRLFDMYGLTALFDPFDWLKKPVLYQIVVGPARVEIAADAQPSPALDLAKDAIEEYVELPESVCVDGRWIAISFNDFLRGFYTVPAVIGHVADAVRAHPRRFGEATLERLGAALEQAANFERSFDTVYRGFSVHLDALLDDFSRIDNQILWRRMLPLELADVPAHTAVCRIAINRAEQSPVYVPVADGRRKAFPCVGVQGRDGLGPIRWNPAHLGIGQQDRDIPVLIGEHAIERLHERVPTAPDYGWLHRLTANSLMAPRLHPGPDGGRVLVEVGQPGRRLGYFVVEIYADLVFVKTFLFLTMQGTPEAKCLREKLGLSRSDIEYFKLDSMFTLAFSDVGEDPELRRALAQCGCDHLLDLDQTSDPVSWLKRYRAPFRREIGLPAGTDIGLPDRGDRDDIEEMIASSKKMVKQSEGWIV